MNFTGWAWWAFKSFSRKARSSAENSSDLLLSRMVQLRETAASGYKQRRTVSA